MFFLFCFFFSVILKTLSAQGEYGTTWYHPTTRCVCVCVGGGGGGGGGGGRGPIYGIVWMYVPNGPLFQRCQVYDWPLFSAKRI